MNHFKNEALAQEIAEALNDMHSLALHRRFAQMYPEPYLRKQLAIALSIPEPEVRTSRAAIYTGLVKRNQ